MKYLVIALMFCSGVLWSQDCRDSLAIDSASFEKHCLLPLSHHRIWKDYQPVCGCDSMTYLSAECAEVHHVNDYTEKGGCQCIDLRVIDTTQVDPFFGISGIYDPVCGCDSITYFNAKVPYFKHGVTNWTTGACDCIEESFTDLKIPGWYSIDTVIFSSLPFYCGCDSISFQNFEVALLKNGVTQWREGKCSCYKEDSISLNEQCSLDLNPVCGCDTFTYRNACIAKKRFGIINFKPGECKCVIKDKVFPAYPCENTIEPVCGCDSITYRNNCHARFRAGLYVTKKGPCKCYDERKKVPNVICSEKYDPVCGCNDSTYFNFCRSEKIHGIIPLNSGPCRCKSVRFLDESIDCEEEFKVDPVCGCDSVTYVNACVALHRGGVTSWTSGPCDFLCVDQYYIDSSIVCDQKYDPVCGCDSITYQNECIARNHFGVKDWIVGHCDSITSTWHLDGWKIELSPNPNNGEFVIKEILASDQVFAVDVKGRKVGLVRNLNSFQLSDVRHGVYYLIIYRDGKKVQLKRVVVVE